MDDASVPAPPRLRLLPRPPAEPGDETAHWPRDVPDPVYVDDQAPGDALEALLLAQRGYQAAVDAADGASLPSLTDFVD